MVKQPVLTSNKLSPFMTFIMGLAALFLLSFVVLYVVGMFSFVALVFWKCWVFFSGHLFMLLPAGLFLVVLVWLGILVEKYVD